MTDEIKSFYDKAYHTVSSVVGVPDMFSSNCEESVDARSILVHILSGRGLTDSQISSFTGLTRQCVNKLKNSVRHRSGKWSYRSFMQQISNELATESF